jgi:acetyl/propionyl-CoA carboxylase alpha subunit
VSVVRRLLVANRGEIARRIQRSCRAMGIETVAVFSEPDRAAPFVREADLAVALGGASAAGSYLRGDAVIEAAARTGADAVHPGYGFLAENAGFARRCREAGLVFVGPSADAIAAMGSKLAAKRRAAAAGVPTLPSVPVPDGAAPGELERAAGSLGFPLLVKAAAGGGGRGMRRVRGAAELAEAVAGARREAEAAFGDGSLYLETCLERARHVEVQIFGDAHGRVVHLSERECSIQRRHQKLVEEAPCTGLDAGLREAICKAAVAVGEAVGYENAGTVEFLLAPDGSFFFLEMNTRLQVEHPVTEMTTGLDLVRMQIEVARGEPLPPQSRIPPARGVALEARLCAEDPAAGHLPSAGRLLRFAIDPLPGLRVDAGVEDGSEVGVHYDSLLAKVVALAPTRAEAAAKLAAALERARLHGLRTNRDWLVRLLRHPEFLAGRADTGFAEARDAELAEPLCDPAAERLHALAAALAAQAARRRDAPVLANVPSGWRNLPSQDQRVALDGPRGAVEVAYRFTREGVRASVAGEPLPDLRVEACSPDDVVFELAGLRRRFAVASYGALWCVDSPLGASELRERPRFAEPEAEAAPGSLRAPMPGTVVAVRVAVGDRVEAGDVLLVLEAMKMEQAIRAPAAGRVALLAAAPGEAVEAGRVLAVIEAEAADGSG